MQNGRKEISSTEVMKFLNQKYLLCGSNFGRIPIFLKNSESLIIF